MPLRQKVSVEYDALSNDQELIAGEAQNELTGCDRWTTCRVLRHRVTTEVTYLVELSDGSRQWFTENAFRAE